jgi:hypothetical protein
VKIFALGQKSLIIRHINYALTSFKIKDNIWIERFSGWLQKTAIDAKFLHPHLLETYISNPGSSNNKLC